MLVLSRKTGQQILIGDSVVVTVLAIQGGIVRLGIDVEPETAIRRSELAKIMPPTVAAHAAVPNVVSF